MKSRPLTVRGRLAALVSALVFTAVAGCTESQLVRNPPPPIFGPRLASAAPEPKTQPVRPRESSPKPVSREVAYSNVPAVWQPSGTERNWQFIVVHHSASEWGSAEQFDRAHRAKGWDELGYHFVIGNGTGSGNGEVEVGGRWFKQKHGAHCKVTGHPEYNDVGIGICLVGNFDQSHPTEAQMESLARLIRYLMGRYNIPLSRVYGHGQLKPTDCPGRQFDYDGLRRRLPG